MYFHYRCQRFCEPCLHHFDTIQAYDRWMARQDVPAMAITVLYIAKIQTSGRAHDI